MEHSKSLILFFVLIFWSKVLSQKVTLRFDPDGAVTEGFTVSIVCESSVSVNLDDILLTLNGHDELIPFNFIRAGSPRRLNFEIEFGTDMLRANVNNVLAQCHYRSIGNASSNPGLVDVNVANENEVPVTLSVSSNERILPAIISRSMSTGIKIIPRLNVVAKQELVITCTPSTPSTDTILLRLNGMEMDQHGSLSITETTDPVTNAATFTINYPSVTDELDGIVVQCTQNVLGSNAFIINITREGCRNCNREENLFCQSATTSRCLSFPSICECSMLCSGESICARCQESCDPDLYYCQPQANCIPFNSFCSQSVDCGPCDTCGVCQNKCRENGELYCPSLGDCITFKDYCNMPVDCGPSCGVINNCEVCEPLCEGDDFFCQSTSSCVSMNSYCNDSGICEIPCRNITCQDQGTPGLSRRDVIVIVVCIIVVVVVVVGGSGGGGVVYVIVKKKRDRPVATTQGPGKVVDEDKEDTL